MQMAMSVGYYQTADVQQTLEAQGNARLLAWAPWAREGDQGLSYPKIEPYTRLVTPSAGGPSGPMPEDVAVTDRAVSVLRFRHKSVLWRAIRQEYLRDDAVIVSARECSVSRAGYYRLIKRAQRAIMELVRQA